MRIYVKNLTAGDVFSVDGSIDRYTVTKVRSGGGVTVVQYLPVKGKQNWESYKPSLSMVTVH